MPSWLEISPFRSYVGIKLFKNDWAVSAAESKFVLVPRAELVVARDVLVVAIDIVGVDVIVGTDDVNGGTSSDNVSARALRRHVL